MDNNAAWGVVKAIQDLAAAVREQTEVLREPALAVEVDDPEKPEAVDKQ
jgi:hypothetical protein